MGQQSRFVSPETTTLPLSNDDWLLVKKRLNVGERRAMVARTYETGPDGQARPNRLLIPTALVTEYVLDWSLIDPDGKQRIIRGKAPHEVMAALDGLDPEAFDEILQAVEMHVLAMKTAREAEKKTRSIGNTSSLTSSLPIDLGGATSGSVS